MKKNSNVKRIFTSFPFIISIFIIIYAAIGVVYYQKHSQYQDLQPQLELNRKILQKPRYDLQALEGELSNIQSQLIAKEAALPKSEQGIEIIDTLIQVAQTSNVEVTSVKGAPPTGKQDDVMGLTILPLTITVQGTQDNILTYISNLTGTPELLNSSNVYSVNIKSSNLSDGEYTTELELYIYAQPQASP